MIGFHTWHYMCEGFGQDSGYRHEESHLMHGMKKFHVGLHFLYGMWYDVCVPLHVHFKWGVALIGEFFYWALLTMSWGNIFQVLEVHRKPKQVQEINCEKGRSVAYSDVL